MALPDSFSKSELSKLYGKKVRNCNLHHLIPSSRKGQTHEFNLFPWRRKSHSAWHYLFLNMTIWEVWENLHDIHEEIFSTDDERINRIWLVVCKLRTEAEVRAHMDKVYSVENLQEKWIATFGGYDLKQAEQLLKYMMLFIIFGSRMADTEYLFDNGNLTEFFEEYPANEDRLKAFDICFGRSADWQRIKAKVSKILR